MNQDPLALLPEALLFGGAVVTLLVGMFCPLARQWIAWLVALAAALGSGTTAAIQAASPRMLYDNSYAVDAATSAARITIAGAAVLLLVLARGRAAATARETEFYVLILLGSTGAVLLAGSSDLVLLGVAYLLSSIPLYALAGWARDAPGAEAALKTYLLGALMSIVMMLGIAVLLAISGGGSTYRELSAGLGSAPTAAAGVGYVAVFAGLLFKISAVPAHYWLPDAVSGSTVPAAAFLTTVPKIGGLIALYRLLGALPDSGPNWALLIAILAALTMTLGNLAAFSQDDVKRLLAYSSISQIGYAMMALAVAGRAPSALPALLIYVAAYAVTNICAFAVLAALPARQRVGDWRGAGRAHPALVATLVVALLGLVGTPPTAVFVGKLAVFTAAWDSGLAWLVVVAALNTVASVYYYLRWLVPAVLPGNEPPAGETIPTGRPAAAVAYLSGAGALLVGLGAALTAGASLLR
jgi:NADH-quinone oxidoreductase subunit N